MRSFTQSFMIATGLLALLAAPALAGGFSIREQSAEGLGAAFAGVAAGTDGLSAMFWNPATISQHNGQGYVSENNLSVILPYSKADNGLPLGNSGNIGKDAIVPASYSVYGLNDQITLGLGINAPFGLATDSDPWLGSPRGDLSKITSINVSPTIAYQPMDWITFAVGLQGEYLKAKLTAQSPAGGPDFFDAKADDFAAGFTAGILLQPADNLDIGIGFRSSISHNLKGDGFLTPAGRNGSLEAPLDTPEMVTVGVKYRPDEQWTLMGGAEWSNWSRLKSLDITFDGPPPLTLSIPENWKDSWFFSAGAEYALNDALTLRGGVAYEISPVTDGARTPRLPDNDRYWLSAGAGYKFNDWFTANIGYSHIFMKDGDINLPAAGPTPALVASFKQHIDLVAVSAVIDW